MNIRNSLASLFLILIFGNQLIAEQTHMKFDKYGDLSVKEEEKRLNDFVIQLRLSQDWKGYVLVYAGRCSYAGEAMARAERAKRYLVKRGIEASRIVTMDGGYRHEFTVDLWLSPSGVTSTPTTFSSLQPNEVKIVKNSREKAACQRAVRARKKTLIRPN